MSFDIRAVTRRIREAGHTMDPPATEAMSLIAESHEKEPYAGVKIERDVSYGPDERNRLDVFAGKGFKAGDARDVLVFMHGGGFVRGDKRMPGSPYHDNVALWAVRNGLVGINITYRLAPQHKWPSGVEDVAGAVEWIRKNIRERGGDPERIFLFGASAGATHMAGYVTHGKLVGASPIAGVILQSGIYDLMVLVGHENGSAYFGTDPKKLAEYSSLKGLVETKTPILYILPEFDGPMWEAGHLQLVNAYFERHKHWPNVMRLMGHNHFTTTTALNSPDTSLGLAILAFMDGAPRS